MSEREPGDILDRTRAHAKPNTARVSSTPSTEDTTVTQDRIERQDEESNFTTADLARSAQRESEERREERREEQVRKEGAPDRAVAGQGQTGRSDIAETPRSAGAATAAAPARDDAAPPLFSSGDAKTLRSRWEALQVGFVDEPRRAVEQADSLVAEAIKRLAQVFAEEREKLEHQWDRGDNVSTEDLRVALQRYRAFFGRLLSV